MGKVGALILAAGRGTRMGTDTPKQFLEVGGKPLFLYSVETYLPLVDRVLLVTGEADIPLCEEILEEYGLKDRVGVVPGGSVRAESSCLGLLALLEEGEYDYVLIHDAARAAVTPEIIERCLDTVRTFGTAVASVPATDTMKIAGPDGLVISTPDRSTLFTIQTPQAFECGLLLSAFGKLFSEAEKDPSLLSRVTDDSMAVETWTDRPVKLFEGSYENRKITVPSDLELFEGALKG